MSPEKTAKQAANLLMVVFKEAEVALPTESEVGRIDYGFHLAPSKKRYLLKAASFEALKKAAAKLVTLMDGYPVKQCIGHLTDIAVAEKDMGTPLAQAHDRMRAKVLEFLRGFENQGQWEVVFAVRGIDPNRGPFQIDPCSFYLYGSRKVYLVVTATFKRAVRATTRGTTL